MSEGKFRESVEHRRQRELLRKMRRNQQLLLWDKEPLCFSSEGDNNERNTKK